MQTSRLPIDVYVVAPALLCWGLEKLIHSAHPHYQLVGSAKGMLHVARFPLPRPDKPSFGITIVHDLSFIERRSQDTRKYLIILIAGLGGVIALVTMVIAQLSWRGWVSRSVRRRAASEIASSTRPSSQASRTCAGG